MQRSKVENAKRGQKGLEDMKSGWGNDWRTLLPRGYQVRSQPNLCPHGWSLHNCEYKSYSLRFLVMMTTALPEIALLVDSDSL